MILRRGGCSLSHERERQRERGLRESERGEGGEGAGDEKLFLPFPPLIQVWPQQTLVLTTHTIHNTRNIRTTGVATTDVSSCALLGSHSDELRHVTHHKRAFEAAEPRDSRLLEPSSPPHLIQSHQETARFW